MSSVSNVVFYFLFYIAITTRICYTVYMDCKDNAQIESIQGEIVDYPEPPPGIRVLSNGAGYSEIEKRIVHGPGTYGPNTTGITPETSIEHNRIRWDKAVQYAMEGGELAVRSAGNGKTGWDAWREINRTQAEMAMDKSLKRTSTEAAKFYGSAAQLLPDRRRASDDGGGSTKITVEIPEHVLLSLLDAARNPTGGGSVE